MHWLLLFVFLTFLSCNSADKKPIDFSGINDNYSQSIEEFLEGKEFGRVSYYFDDMNKQDGEWNLYPQVKMSDKDFLINISNISDAIGYNYIILLDTSIWQIVDTIGPFYDSYVRSVDYSNIDDGYSIELTVENPPDDEVRTFVQKHLINNRIK